MKKFLVILAIILLTAGKCTTDEIKEAEYGSNQRMYYELDQDYRSMVQVDSVCNVERVPVDASKWINGSSILKEESRGYIKQRLFILNDSTVYVITDLDTLYNIKKRVVRTIK